MKTIYLSVISALALSAWSHSAIAGAGHDGDHWMAPAEAAKRPNPVPANKDSLARGKKIYLDSCASCHGTTGRGDGPAGKALKPKPADLVAMAGGHTDGDYAWKIENGRGPMPGWKTLLTQDQIWDVVNYIQSLGGPKPKAKSPKPAKDGHSGHAH